MATFISLVSLTQHGEEEIKQSTERAQGFAELAARLGASVKDVYWTLGSYDGVLIFDAPDDETSTALLLSLGSKGNVRTKTLRAFNSEQITGILNSLP